MQIHLALIWGVILCSGHYTPKDIEERVFPRMSALANGTTYKGETLPAAARTMNFRLTARDGKGGVNEDDMTVTVDESMGPFLVSGGVLNAGGGFLPGSQQTIEWSVGNTECFLPTGSDKPPGLQSSWD